MQNIDKFIVLCIGIPGSGKSTWTKQFLKKYRLTNTPFIKIGKDYLREYFTDLNSTEYWNFVKENKYGSAIEKFIWDIEYEQINRAIASGLNIIIDNTNGNITKIEHIIEIATIFEYEIKIKIFDIDIEEAKKRVINRDLGKDINYIDKYLSGFLITKEHILKNHKNKIINY